MEIANPRPSAGRYHGARDLRTNSRSPPLSYAYRPLHLRLILLRFPRGTRARNSFPLGDRVLGLSLRCIDVNLSPPVPRSTALENEKPARHYKSCRGQSVSSSFPSLLLCQRQAARSPSATRRGESGIPRSRSLLLILFSDYRPPYALPLTCKPALYA